jgi:plastocyanin
MTPTAPPAAATPTPPPTTAHDVAVGQGGNNFVDSRSGNSTTTVRMGETVTWTWVGALHSTTSGSCCTGSGIWDSGIKSNGSFSHTFASAGSFPYFCTVHGSAMTGMVVVSP